MWDFLLGKRTKIVCTIGPASETPEILEQMIRAGMNVARLNFSHGDFASHMEMIANVRSAALHCDDIPVGILQDLQGPRIRLGDLREPVSISSGDEVVFTTAYEEQVDEKIPVTYNGLHEDVSVGNNILIADGTIHLSVKELNGNDILCSVEVGGTLKSHKGLNVPGVSLGVPTITGKDEQDLHFGIQQGVDFVALSFVRGVEDIKRLRELIDRNVKEIGGEAFAPKVFAKIERHEAVVELRHLVEVCDGIMVARGDLGVEIPSEQVPVVQKDAIGHCLQYAKPCIVATQMLESMISNARPTRAEVSDVSHAVMDHADAVMLSGETSVGEYPVQAVDVMAKTAHVAEQSLYDDLASDEVVHSFGDPRFSCARSAVDLVRRTAAKALLVATETGFAARILARYRAEVPLIALTSSLATARQLSLVWGVLPYYVDTDNLRESLLRSGEIVKQFGVFDDERIIVVSSQKGKAIDDIDRVTVKQV